MSENIQDITPKQSYLDFLRNTSTEDLFQEVAIKHDIKEVINTNTLIKQLGFIFQRGFRWRPDNGLLICYRSDYNIPWEQIDEKDFDRAVCLILLITKKVKNLTE